MSTPLTVVRQDGPAQRAAGLLVEARDHARAHVAHTIAAMGDLTRDADVIADGDVVYPAGVRDEMRRLADHLQAVATRCALIMERQP